MTGCRRRELDLTKAVSQCKWVFNVIIPSWRAIRWSVWLSPGSEIPIGESVFLLEMCRDIFGANSASFIKTSVFKGDSNGSGIILASAVWCRRAIRDSVCVHPHWRPTHTLAKPPHVALWVCLILALVVEKHLNTIAESHHSFCLFLSQKLCKREKWK